MRVALLALALVCLVGLSVGERESKFFDFFFDIEYRRGSERIVGGAAVTITKYPYIVSLRRNSNHICAGSVISTYYAVTCAHCTYSLVLTGVTIYAGSTSRTTGGKIFKVTAITNHPDYDPDTFNSDVSVLRVSTPFTPNTNIAPVPLVAANTVYAAGSLGYVAGWGRTTSGSALSATLRAVSIPFVSDESCASLWTNAVLTDTMICAGIKGRDACIGDSGGPLVVTNPANNVNMIAGMVSWGSASCGSEYPGVYTSFASPTIRNFLVAYL